MLSASKLELETFFWLVLIFRFATGLGYQLIDLPCIAWGTKLHGVQSTGKHTRIIPADGDVDEIVIKVTRSMDADGWMDL